MLFGFSIFGPVLVQYVFTPHGLSERDCLFMVFILEPIVTVFTPDPKRVHTMAKKTNKTKLSSIQTD